MSKYSKKSSKKKVVIRDDKDFINESNKSLSHPVLELPELNMMPIYHTKRRWTASSAVSGIMTIYQCFEQFRLAISATTAYSYVRAFRIKRIRILASVATSGTPVTVQVQPTTTTDSTLNCFNSCPSIFSDTSSNLSIPAFVDVQPSSKTPLGSWHTNQLVNNNLSTIVAPSGSIMDIDFEFILNIGGNSSTYTSTSAGMTAGFLYAGNMVTNFVPVALVYV